MDSDERKQFNETYGFDPGECVCKEDDASGNMREITQCHADLLDKFVDRVEEQHAYIIKRETYIAEVEMRLSLLGEVKMDG